MNPSGCNQAIQTLIHAYNANSGPPPQGPYSSVVRVDNTLYLSGLIGMDPKADKLVNGGTENETRRIMIYLRRVLEEAGSSLERICVVRMYVTNIGDAKVINDVYEEFMQAPFPARVMVQVSSLPLGAKIEMEIMAMITGSCRI